MSQTLEIGVCIVEDAVERVNEKTQVPFTCLLLKEDMFFQRSSGAVTAGTKRVSMPVEWPLAKALTLKGKQIPFNIIKQECESYEYPVGSGQFISHTWVAVPQ